VNRFNFPSPIVRRALVSGAFGSILSTVALVACGKLETGSGAGAVNGPSEWIWGRRAAHRRDASARHTVLGYLIHHVASCGWAAMYERWVGTRRRSPAAGEVLAKAAATAALAAVVDYRVAPKRLRPGFEVQLSKPSLVLVYAAFAAGLAIASMRRTPGA
jgi:hypothetical protein